MHDRRQAAAADRVHGKHFEGVEHQQEGKFLSSQTLPEDAAILGMTDFQNRNAQLGALAEQVQVAAEPS